MARACATAVLGAIALLSIMAVGPAGLVENTAFAQKRQAQRSITIEVSKGRLVRLPRAAKTVFIADPNVADVQVKSSRIIYLLGKKVGETTLIAVDENDRVLINTGVTVNHNLSRLRRVIDTVLPNNKVQLRSLDGAVLLRGRVKNQANAIRVHQIASQFVQDPDKNLINHLAIMGPNQVNVRVRIIEISKDTLKRLGINWDAAIRKGQFVFGLATGQDTFGDNGFGSFDTRTGTNFSSNSLGVNYSFGNVDLNGLIDVLDRNGFLKVLAEPNLSAMSGKKASFLAGGEFPVPIPQDDDVTTIEYKKYGVSLSLTPVILSRNRIKITIAPEVSTLARQNAVELNGMSVPSLLVRKAETMVQVASGQSIIIGGLFMNNVSKDIRKVPGLGDLPILGKLFTSQEYRRNESELVIIATPYLVKPFDAKKQLKKGAKAGMILGSKTFAQFKDVRSARTARGARTQTVTGPRFRAVGKVPKPKSGFILE